MKREKDEKDTILRCGSSNILLSQALASSPIRISN